MKIAGIVQEFTPYARALSEASQNGRITLEGTIKRIGHKYNGEILLSEISSLLFSSSILGFRF